MLFISQYSALVHPAIHLAAPGGRTRISYHLLTRDPVFGVDLLSLFCAVGK